MTKRSADEIERWLITHVAECTGVAEGDLEPATPFFEFGLESSDVVDLSAALSRFLERPVDATVAWNFPTIRSLATHLGDTGASRAVEASEPERGVSGQLLDDLLKELYEG